jgi:pimeloyl-ACP methyl ester carboxylesterase
VFDAELARAFSSGDLAGAARQFLALWSDGPPFDDLPEAMQQRIVARMEMVRATALVLNDDSAGMLRGRELEALDLPVLILRGGASPPVTDAICRRLAERLPQARYAIIPGAGHMLPITHPGETAALIDAFLAPCLTN